MSAPLSLRDKQFAFLVGQYGPGLSYADMLSKYRGGGKSLSDLEYAAYLGDSKLSLADNMNAAIPGSGSLSDKQYASASGGLSVVNPITDGPVSLYSFWAGDPTVAVNDGDLITNWKTLSNIGGTARPTYKKSDPTLSNKPSLIFNGTTNYLSLDVTDAAQNYYAVCISSGNTAGRGSLGTGGSVAATDGIGIRSGNSNWFSCAGTVLDSLILASAAAPTLVSAKFAGAASDIQVNSVAAVVGNAGAEVLSFFKVGCMGLVGANASFWVGSIAFAAIYSNDPRLDPKWSKILDFARSCGVPV
jgi:hypothetical protein